MPHSEFQVLLYYKYVPIGDPEGFHLEHRELCERLALRGRILIGEEGINGTVSGPLASTEAYMAEMKGDSRFSDMVFKVDPHDGHAFPKLSIKVRSEIVSLHLEGEDFHPTEVTGKRLSPKEWYKAIQDEDVIILDGRNDYESDLGHFKGAVCPPLHNFREFPDWIRENLADAKGKKVLTYCTGGIRCEKLSGFLVREGFTDVSQLEGGIVSYGKDPETKGRDFEGKCFVFDERIAVEVNHTPTARMVATCRDCGEPCERYVNCRNKDCNAKIFLCVGCESSRGRYCAPECKALVVDKEGVG